MNTEINDIKVFGNEHCFKNFSIIKISHIPNIVFYLTGCFPKTTSEMNWLYRPSHGSEPDPPFYAVPMGTSFPSSKLGAFSSESNLNIVIKDQTGDGRFDTGS